jgi:hypothetical protein
MKINTGNSIFNFFGSVILAPFLQQMLYTFLPTLLQVSVLLKRKVGHPSPFLLHPPSVNYPYYFLHHPFNKKKSSLILILNIPPLLMDQGEPKSGGIHLSNHSIQELLKIQQVLQQSFIALFYKSF